VSESRASQHILFPRVLCAFAVEDAVNLHRNLGKPGAEDYLADLWRNAGLQWLGSSEPAEGLSLSRYEFSDRIQVDVIQLPAPHAAPDAACVAVVYWIEKLIYRGSTLKVTKVATAGKTVALELADEPLGANPEYCVHESWGLSRQTNRYHGSLEAADEDSFVSFLREIVGTPATIGEFYHRSDGERGS